MERQTDSVGSIARRLGLPEDTVTQLRRNELKIIAADRKKKDEILDSLDSIAAKLDAMGIPRARLGVTDTEINIRLNIKRILGHQ